jgi:hypothetical protein
LRINWFILSSGRLQKQPTITGWPTADLNQLGESWFDVEEATPERARVVWGISMLMFLTYLITVEREAKPHPSMIQHFVIAAIVIIVSLLLRSWILASFNG